MTGRTGVKAGLIGGGVAVILALLGLIPCVGCVTFPLIFVAFAVAGGLAAAWLGHPRTASDGAGAGAMAGVISGVLGGLATMGVSVLSYYLAGGADYFIRSLPPDTLRQLQQYGIDPTTFFTPGLFAASAGVCCGVIFLAAIGIAAIVGAIVGASGPRPASPQEGSLPDDRLD